MINTTYYIIDYNNLPHSLEILEVCDKFYTLEKGKDWRKVIAKELLHKFIEDKKVKLAAQLFMQKNVWEYSKFYGGKSIFSQKFLDFLLVQNLSYTKEDIFLYCRKNYPISKKEFEEKWIKIQIKKEEEN